MNSYPKLTESLRIRTEEDQRHRFGQHISSRSRVTSSGMKISDTLFDPSIHEIGSIDSNSLDEEYYDYPRAVLRQPEIESRINVLVNIDNKHKERRIPKFVSDSKITMSNIIVNSLSSSKPFEDTIDTKQYDRLSLKAIQESAKTGLTLIISDFNKINLDSANITRNAIGIKINHSFEVGKISRSIGRITLSGGSHECNTNNTNELRSVNQSLEEKHIKTIELLKKLGIPVLPLIYPIDDKQQQLDFFNNVLPKAISRLKSSR